MMLNLKEYRLSLPHGCRSVFLNHRGERMTGPGKLPRDLFRRARLYRKGTLLHTLRYTRMTERLHEETDNEVVRGGSSGTRMSP